MMKKCSALLAATLAAAMLTVPAFAEETYPQLTGESGKYNAGVYEEVVRGMGGRMTFHITFSADAIESIEVVKHTETENIGTLAIDRVIPKMIENQTWEVDAQTGATITSDAIKEAVKLAVEQATVAAATAASYTPGTYEVTVRGMGGRMTVAVTFTDSAIEKIEVTKHTETENIGTLAIDRVIPKMIENQTWEVDAQAGATITSDALKDAVKQAMEQAAK